MEYIHFHLSVLARYTSKGNTNIQLLRINTI